MRRPACETPRSRQASGTAIDARGSPAWGDATAAPRDGVLTPRGFTRHLISALAVWVVLSAACGTAAAASVNYGDISHKNLKDLRAGVDRHEAAVGDQDGRQPVGDRKRGQVGE